MAYDAFISYSHSADGQLAPAVQTALQRLARPWYRRRALRVFRDQTGLSVNPHIQESIEAALHDSRYFVLLASPSAAASPWVDRELNLWLESKSADTILPVLTEGELEWDDTAGDFDSAMSTALPPALRGAYAAEPLFLDLRWARDEDHLDLRHATFRSQVAAIAAPMHGIAKEDLEGEDVRLHRRAMRLAWGVAVSLLVLTVTAVAFAAYANSQRQRAEDVTTELIAANGTVEEQQQNIDEQEDEIAGNRQIINRNRATLASQKETLEGQKETLEGQEAWIKGQDASIDQQASTIDQQASTIDQQTSTIDQQTSTIDQQTSTIDQQTGTIDQQTGTIDQQTGTIDQQTGTIDQQTGTIDQQGNTIDQQGNTIDQQGNTITHQGGQITQQIQTIADQRTAIDGHTATIAKQEAELAAKVIELNRAEHARVDAENGERRAGASSESTDLSIAAREQLDSAADLSLLLSVAATQVTAEVVSPTETEMAARSTAPSVPDPVGAHSANARGMLLSAVNAVGNGVAGFLHFPERDGPQALAPIAVSPDGEWIAAAETSDAISNGEAKARIFVWHAVDGDPTSARAVEITTENDRAACVAELVWTAANQLLSVEHPDGCWQQRYATDEAPYLATRVRAWRVPGTSPLTPPAKLAHYFDPAKAPDAVHTLLNGPLASSPITTTPDHRFVAISYMAGDAPFQARLLVIDSLHHHFDLQTPRDPNLVLAEPFGQEGRWESDYDGNTGLPALYDLHNWLSGCPSGNDIEQAVGCFAKYPFSLSGLPLSTFKLAPSEAAAGAIFSSPDLTLLPDIVVIIDLTQKAPEFFDVLLVPDNVRVDGFAFGDRTVMLTTSEATGTTAFNTQGVATQRWDDAATDWQMAALDLDPECPVLPEIGSAGRFLLLEQVCPNARETLVLSAGEGSAHLPTLSVLRRLRGTVLASSTDERFVISQQLEFKRDPTTGLTDLAIGFEIWDFSAPDDESGIELNPTGTLVDFRSDARAFVSPDATTVIAFAYHLPGSSAVQATVWDLGAETVGARTLPASLGVRAVAFLGEHDVFGVGEMGAGVAWDVRGRSYRNMYPNGPIPAVCSTPPEGPIPFLDTSLRSALRPDMRERALSRDAYTIELLDPESSGPGTIVNGLDIRAGERISYMTYSTDGLRLLVNLEETEAKTCRAGAIVPYTASVVVDLVTMTSQRFDGEIALRSSGDGTRILFRSLDGAAVRVRDERLAVLGTISTDALPPDGNSTTGNLYAIDEAGDRVAGTNATGRTVVWTLDGGIVFEESPSPAVQPTSSVDFAGIAFDPDGVHLATKTVDQRLMIWDIGATNGAPRSMRLPLDARARVAYSPVEFGLIAVDGTYLIDKDTLRIVGPRLKPVDWNISVFDNGSQATRFYNDGDALYLAVERSLDLDAAVWRVDIEGLRAQACRLAGRNFTEHEFALYRVPGQVGSAPCV